MKLSAPLLALVALLLLTSCKSDGANNNAAPGAASATPTATPLPPGVEEASVERFQRDVQQDPNDMAAHFNLGNMYLLSGKYKEAADEYGLVASKDPKDFDALKGLGNARAALGEYDAAIDAYKRAAEANPKDAEVRVRLSEAYAKAGRAAEANAERAAADRLDPSQAARILSGEGKHKEALAVLRKVTNKNAQTYVLEGDAHFALQQYAEAAAAYEQATRRDPKSASAYFQLGNARSRLNQHAEAAAAFQQAARLNPQDADAFYNLGNAYAKLKKYGDAVGAYTQAIKLNPQDKQARYWLALLHLENGNAGGAGEQYEALKGIDADLAEQLRQAITQKTAAR